MEPAITPEESAELDALLALRVGLVSERLRLVNAGLPHHHIEGRLTEINSLITPLNVKRGHDRNRKEHEALVTGSTFSQLMKMCSLVTGLVKRGVQLTPAELERFRTIAISTNHTKAVKWFETQEPKEA